MPKSIAGEVFKVSDPVAAALRLFAEEAWRNQRDVREPPDPSINWTIRGWAAEYAWRKIIREIAQRRYCARGFYIGVGEEPRMDMEVETGVASGEALSDAVKVDVRATSPDYVKTYQGIAYPAARLEAGQPEQDDCPDLIVAAVAEYTDASDWAVQFIGALEWQAAAELAKGLATLPGKPPFKCLPMTAFKWDQLEVRLPLPPGEWSWR